MGCSLWNNLCPANKKDVLPGFQQSNVIYQFSCHCDSWYLGRTSQRLQDRIKQHVLKSIRNATSCSQTHSQQNAIVNLQSSRCLQTNLYHAILPSVYIYYAIFSFIRLKPSKPQTRSFADKKNLSTFSCCSRIN